MVWSILFYPLSWFVDRPWLALLPVGFFIGCHVWLHRTLGKEKRLAQIVLLLAAMAWLLYGVYEWRMDQWAKTVTAPIRLDLLLIAPVLDMVSFAGLAAGWLGLRASISRR